MSFQFQRFSVIMLGGLLLGGCGYKGPLTLPSQNQASHFHEHDSGPGPSFDKDPNNTPDSGQYETEIGSFPDNSPNVR